MGATRAQGEPSADAREVARALQDLEGGGGLALEREAVSVRGPEAVAYLQGQLSQDIAALEVGRSTWSLVLAPTGKLDAWVRVSRPAAAELVLDVEPGAGAALEARLRRFLLRTDATVERLDDWTTVVTPCAPTAFASPPEGATGVVSGQLGWPGLAGTVDAWRGDVPAMEGGGHRRAAFEVLRVRHGVPAWGAELVEGLIPAEVGQWFVDRSVSFTKGCFTGQELVARIDSRGGNVARRLVGLRSVAADSRPTSEGGAVGAELTEDGAAVGSVTSLVQDPAAGWIGLGFLARRVEVPAALAVVVDTREIQLEAVTLPSATAPSGPG